MTIDWKKDWIGKTQNWEIEDDNEIKSDNGWFRWFDGIDIKSLIII